MFKLPELKSCSSINEAIDSDLVLVFQDKDKKPIPPKGPYSELVARFGKGSSSPFAARHGSAQFIRFGGKGKAENVLFVGLGPKAELTEEKLRLAGGTVWSKLSHEKVKSVAIHADLSLRLVRALADGMVLGAYSFLKYKDNKKDQDKKDKYAGPSQIVFVARQKALQKRLESELPLVHAMGEAISIARDWSNEPSNIGTPEYFASEAKRLAKEYGLKCRILDEKEARREKMGLFLGVGQGAEREGRIVVLEYEPKGATLGGGRKKNPKTIALVGKGVTFDSGGISIKPSMRMEEMKHDMSGAATVLGATLLAAKWQVPNRIVTVMAFTENMPDGNAMQPGNILTSRSGKTVEIVNTDAEGRLILADALDFVQDYKPAVIVDAATLTGAVSVALGKICCAILGNDEPLINAVKRAGESEGERIWQLPLFDEYFDDLKSEYADMKNSANDSYGGTIRGAIFMKQFIRKGIRWAHLDIAATATNLSHLSYYPKKGASGAFVRTLARFAASF